jgi:pSer/pThr/pTyr-binding forkhead associated (FHA) protein
VALIIEVLDAEERTVRARVRAGALPFTIGRAWDNDLILEDLYVDARHARIHRAVDGTMLVEALGSLNGLAVIRGDGSSEKQVRVVAAQRGLDWQVSSVAGQFPGSSGCA